MSFWNAVAVCLIVWAVFELLLARAMWQNGDGSREGGQQ